MAIVNSPTLDSGLCKAARAPAAGLGLLGTLPPEIRGMIYPHLIDERQAFIPKDEDHQRHPLLDMLAVNSQFRAELLCHMRRHRPFSIFDVNLKHRERWYEELASVWGWGEIVCVVRNVFYPEVRRGVCWYTFGAARGVDVNDYELWRLDSKDSTKTGCGPLKGPVMWLSEGEKKREEVKGVS